MKSQSKALFPTAAALIILLAVLVVPSSSKQPDEDSNTSCGTIASRAGPCHAYFKAESDEPSTACCDGAKFLLATFNTTDLRQEACFCGKRLIKSFEHEISVAQGLPLAKAMPGLCDFIFQFPIDPNVDCSTIP